MTALDRQRESGHPWIYQSTVFGDASYPSRTTKILPGFDSPKPSFPLDYHLRRVEEIDNAADHKDDFVSTVQSTWSFVVHVGAQAKQAEVIATRNTWSIATINWSVQFGGSVEPIYHPLTGKIVDVTYAPTLDMVFGPSSTTGTWNQTASPQMIDTSGTLAIDRLATKEWLPVT